MKHSPFDLSMRIMFALVLLLGTLMLCVGDRSYGLFAASLAVIAISFWCVDLKGWFHLHPRAASWAAAGAVGWTALQVATSNRLEQIMAVGALQSYLQYVLLFQAKAPRIYWQLVMLSLGQVAIASTLVVGPTFGGLAILYLLCATIALSMLLVASESARCSGVYLATLTPVAASSRLFGSSSLGRPPQLRGAVASLASGNLRELLSHAILIFLGTLPVVALVYFAIPRWDVMDRNVLINEPLRTIGFTKTVTLGELGDVVNNDDLVMRVQFFRGMSRQPFKLDNEPLFRGAVLTRYVGGKWSQTDNNGTMVMPAQVRIPFVRQRLTLEPTDETSLCGVFPVFALSSDPRLRIDTRGDQMYRHEDYRSQHLEFDVGTLGIDGTRQRTILPREARLERDAVRRLQAQLNPRRGVDPHAGLRQVAARVLEEEEISASDRVAAARALSDYFHTSGKFFYSLDAQPREPTLDPLEDFVTKHPYGHCEYFAGALVMMLRTQGIPARMVIGFKGGEWNELGQFYQVQQLHAHAWVEAYLDGDDIPPVAFPDEEPPPAAWLVLDPTELTSEGGGETQQRPFLARMRQYVDYGQMLWSNYIVSFNASRQRQGIYEPLAQGVTAALENLFGPDAWRARWKALSKSPLRDFWEWYRRHWFSFSGGVTAIAFCLFVAGTVAVLRALAGWYWQVRHGGQETGVHEIYRRLEAALSHRGLTRKPAQTAFEFAQAAGGELAEDLRCCPVAHLPRRVVEAFYRVRYGRRTLDSKEAEAVEHALRDLEIVLSQARNRGSLPSGAGRT